MPESYRGESPAALSQLKNNRTGNLKLKNGRLAVDTGTSTYYTTIVGTANPAEAVAGDESDELKNAKSATTHTGSLYLSSGALKVTGYAGTITLID